MHGELFIIAAIIVGYMYIQLRNTVTSFIKKMNTILYSCLMHICGCMPTVFVVDGLGTRVLGKNHSGMHNSNSQQSYC